MRLFRDQKITLEVFAYEYEYLAELRELWARHEPQQESTLEESDEEFDPGIRFSRARPRPMAWSIAFTSDFRKSVADIDKKLQGRILEVISDLSQDPLTAQGDTKKPLTGEFKGLWRHRIGEYRLVYEPVLAGQQVVLLEFASRGSIYQQ